ncbi:DUF5789 family protein [Halosimplex halophilum]|uniref:DUF5789 family protein n=1 Tax=Halosimplex halophilum TaxID=2559572 RepID=UPI00107FCA46|nr:hypothetical protein [Halosimplex halophilum]
MRITETRQLFTESCEYPTDAATVADRVGDVEIEAPTGDTTTVETVLARSNVRTYESADDAYTALMGNLDDSFIGLKYYDDRGDNQPHPHRNWH